MRIFCGMVFSGRKILISCFEVVKVFYLKMIDGFLCIGQSLNLARNFQLRMLQSREFKIRDIEIVQFAIDSAVYSYLFILLFVKCRS